MNKLIIIEYLKDSLEAMKAFANNLVGELTQITVKALEEMENNKADKPKATSISIPTTGWANDKSVGYPYYYDLTVTGVTAKDRVEITVAPSSLETAKACGLCPTNETLKNKIRIRSVSAPKAAITAEYWVETGKE